MVQFEFLSGTRSLTPTRALVTTRARLTGIRDDDLLFFKLYQCPEGPRLPSTPRFHVSCPQSFFTREWRGELNEGKDFCGLMCGFNGIDRLYQRREGLFLRHRSGHE